MSILKTSLLCSFLALVPVANAQQAMSNFDRSRAQTMLQVVTSEVRKNYYDPQMHGLNWDATVNEAKQKIEKETSFNMALSHIAAALDTLHDSHTFFTPPPRSYRHDFGWRYQMIGERCFVVRVKPGTDADSKEIAPGDEVLSINGYAPTRDNLWKMNYAFSILRPQPGLRVELKTPKGPERKLDVMASMRAMPKYNDLSSSSVWDFIRDAEDESRAMRAQYVEVGQDLMILRLPIFLFSQAEIQDIMARARKHKALIVDLRGNPGGRVDTLSWLIGSMFDHDIKIGDRVTRENMKEQTAKTFGKETFTGKVVVLIDSDSASASEIFARVMQLEKRGTVIGDRSSGSVMESRRYSYKMGGDIVLFYGASITEADLRMKDGNSLEHVGVTPDDVSLPTADDLVNRRDPVMAHAAKVLGYELSAEAAGKFFPYIWPKE